MPLFWTIDSRSRLILAKAEGEVSLPDARRLLGAVSGANALSYRKLFDGRGATWSMSDQDLLTLCVEVRSYHQRGPMGALAVVATPDQTLVFARLLGALATADRPMKVFEGLKQARRWIDDQPDLLANASTRATADVTANIQANGKADA